MPRPHIVIVGAGFGGLSVAHGLAGTAADVTVIDREQAPGGMLRYGIPEYRLPKATVLEPEYEAVWRLGAHFVGNRALGTDFTLDDLRDPARLQVLRWMFHDPEQLRPGVTREIMLNLCRELGIPTREAPIEATYQIDEAGARAAQLPVGSLNLCERII